MDMYTSSGPNQFPETQIHLNQEDHTRCNNTAADTAANGPLSGGPRSHGCCVASTSHGWFALPRACHTGPQQSHNLPKHTRHVNLSTPLQNAAQPTTPRYRYRTPHSAAQHSIAGYTSSRGEKEISYHRHITHRAIPCFCSNAHNQTQPPAIAGHAPRCVHTTVEQLGTMLSNAMGLSVRRAAPSHSARSML
jgi:hypothetical protein